MKDIILLNKEYRGDGVSWGRSFCHDTGVKRKKLTS